MKKNNITPASDLKEGANAAVVPPFFLPPLVYDSLLLRIKAGRKPNQDHSTSIKRSGQRCTIVIFFLLPSFFTSPRCVCILYSSFLLAVVSRVLAPCVLRKSISIVHPPATKAVAHAANTSTFFLVAVVSTPPCSYVKKSVRKPKINISHSPTKQYPMLQSSLLLACDPLSRLLAPTTVRTQHMHIILHPQAVANDKCCI